MEFTPRVTAGAPNSPGDRGQALPSGTRIEEFVIERVLGSGGFGITYLARDTRLGRQVVIKENLPAQYCFRDPASLTVAPRHTHADDVENFRWSMENFSREAAMLASLDHPGIVRVLGSFEAFGTTYFVMPFVEGRTLDQLATERASDPFSEDELLGLLEWLLDALSYLHERGIFHRDIKPANILITHEGKPVLIDFGSARQRLTERSMTVIESAGYTPFEQLQSRGKVGPWSDLYALAATVVKAMTGNAPPKANDRTMGDIWQPLAGRDQLQGRFSRDFLQSLDRALRLPVEERWQSVGEWKVILAKNGRREKPNTNKITENPDPVELPGVITRKRSFAYPLALVIFMLVALLGGYLSSKLNRNGTSPMVRDVIDELPQKGSLLISSEPVGATVKDLSGKDMGKTPVGITGLGIDRTWKGALELDGYKSATIEAVARAGDVTKLPTVRLIPLAQKVRVNSAPAGATVFEGKKELGQTPMEIGNVAPETLVRYKLSLKGHEDGEVSGKVDVGRPLVLHAELKPMTSPMPVVDPRVADLLDKAREARLAGEMGQSIEKLEKALTESPDDPSVHFELGLVHEQMGVFDTAAAHFEKVFQMGGQPRGRAI